MPLVKQTLKTGILTMLREFKQQQDITGEQAEELFADRMSTLIDTYIRSGTVVTTGSATTQTGTIQ